MGTRRGGLASGDVKSGITTTVLLWRLTTSVLSTRQGRVFLISDPRLGSRRTHHTSPRFGAAPGLADLVGNGIEFLLYSSHLEIAIRNFTGADKPQISLLELLSDRLGQVAGAMPGRNALNKPVSQLTRQCEGHLSCRHIYLLPYSRALTRRPKRLPVVGRRSAPVRRSFRGRRAYSKPARKRVRHVGTGRVRSRELQRLAASGSGRAEGFGKVRRALSHSSGATQFPVARASCPGAVTAKMSVPHHNESLLIFRLTSQDGYDSLSQWSFCGQFVAGRRRDCSSAKERGSVLAVLRKQGHTKNEK